MDKEADEGYRGLERQGDSSAALCTEDEGYEGGYEATTLSGVPQSLTGTTSSGRNSRTDALNDLLTGLRTFGFTERLAVQDATELGRTEHTVLS